MGVFFTGVNTGRFHEVGRKNYELNGDRYSANSDGSFTNLRSGITLKGSSQSNKTRWYSDDESSSENSRSSNSVNRSGNSQPAAAPAPAALVGGGSGAGSERVVRGSGNPASAGGAGPASPVITTTKSGRGGNLVFSGPWSNEKAEPYEGVQPHSFETKNGLIPNQGPWDVKGRKSPMGVVDWESNPYWPTGEVLEEEHGEILAAPLALGKIVAGDIPWNVQRYGNFINSNPRSSWDPVSKFFFDVGNTALKPFGADR